MQQMSFVPEQTGKSSKKTEADPMQPGIFSKLSKGFAQPRYEGPRLEK